jgi:hypothetical protein
MEAYRKDQALENELTAINQALEPHEPAVTADGPSQPHLFVFGLPRSGTTLTHQVLACGLDLGYVSNIMARFWLAPHAGAVLSRAVLGETVDESFASDYGYVHGPAGPHEFAYFWCRWLGIADTKDMLDFSGDSAKADWPGAAAAVARIQAAFAKPLIFKTSYAGQFLPAFARSFPMPMFIHAWRDPWPVARSILHARRRIYGDPSVWWSTYPPDYEMLRQRPVADQIAGQVAGLRRAHAALIAQVPPELVLDVPYDKLCERPSELIEGVRRRCREVHGVAPALRRPVPDGFEHSQPRGPQSEEEEALAAALERALAEPQT